MEKITPNTIASWLNGEKVDELGGNDEEFAEAFVRWSKMRKKDYSPLSAEDMRNADIDKLVADLKGILTEIIQDEDVCESAWWKLDRTNEQPVIASGLSDTD